VSRRAVVHRVLWSALALAVAVAGWAAVGDPGGEWGTVRRGELVSEVEVTGILEAVQADFLGTPPVPRQWDFKIELMAAEGETVEQGQPVLAFDASELRRRLQEAQASHEQAVKQLEKREIDFRLLRNEATLALTEAEGRARVAALKVDVPGELIAARELAAVKLDLRLAHQEVTYQRERLAALADQEGAELTALRQKRDREAGRIVELEQAIAMMRVLAPRRGPVIVIADWEGKKKKIGDSAWRGESLLQIPDLSAMKAQGEVDEAEAGRLRPGQRVVLILDAFPDDELSGRIVQVKSTVQRRSPDDPAKVVGIEIALDETDSTKVRPGMRFRGTVEVDRNEVVVLAPALAVFPTAGGAVAWRRGFLGPERVAVRLGRRDGDDVEVVEGLAAGDSISLRPLEELR
jgi:HlyD family secretion protein